MRWSLHFILASTWPAPRVIWIIRDKKIERFSLHYLGDDSIMFSRLLFNVFLVRHLHYVGSRACYRTALEICKVLLNLDPSADPLAMVLTLDFYALRSRCYQWLVDFYKCSNPTRNLSQLPNFAYSVALATFHLYQESSNNQELLQEADNLLQSALLSFPSVLLSLLDKCSIEPDPSVMGCQYFLDTRSDPAALAALSSLYVSRYSS